VWLIQKFGVKPLWIFSRTLIALSCVVLAFSGNYVTALLYVLLAGFSIGSLSALDGMVSREFLPIGDLGTLNGILSLSYGVSSMVGLVVFGWINGVSTSRTPSAILMALTAMIAVCMSLPLLRARSSTAQVPATP
jgi:MFS family permease